MCEFNTTEKASGNLRLQCILWQKHLAVYYADMPISLMLTGTAREWQKPGFLLGKR